MSDSKIDARGSHTDPHVGESISWLGFWLIVKLELMIPREKDSVSQTAGALESNPYC